MVMNFYLESGKGSELNDLCFSLPFSVTSDEADIIQGKYPVVTWSLITWLN